MNWKLGAVLLAVLVSCSCASSRQPTVTFSGTAMLPSIKDGETLRVQILDSNARRQLERGDIVVFQDPRDNSKSAIKRIIGLPEDELEIRGNEVWINGTKLSEPYLDTRLNLLQRSLVIQNVPPHSYFMMSDNRDNSADSRVWGPVAEGLIEAKVIDR